MLNLKNVSYLFLLIILILNVLNFKFGISAWWYVLPVGVLLVSTGLGSFFIGLNFYFRSVNTVKHQNAIALTFDDGPHPEYTRQIMSVLKKHNVKACFFCIGSRAEDQGLLLREMIAEGHILANHSYSHNNLFDLKTARKMTADIQRCSRVIESHTGKKVRYFRPPFGVTNPALKRAVKKTGMLSVGWSLRSLDTMKTRRKTLMKRLSRVKPGHIVLFHDNIQNNDLLLDEFIAFCLSSGLKILPLDVLLNERAYE